MMSESEVSSIGGRLAELGFRTARVIEYPFDRDHLVSGSIIIESAFLQTPERIVIMEGARLVAADFAQFLGEQQSLNGQVFSPEGCTGPMDLAHNVVQWAVSNERHRTFAKVEGKGTGSLDYGISRNYAKTVGYWDGIGIHIPAPSLSRGIDDHLRNLHLLKDYQQKLIPPLTDQRYPF